MRANKAMEQSTAIKQTQTQSHIDQATILKLVSNKSQNGDVMTSLSAGLIDDEEGFKQLEDEWDPLLEKADGMVYSTFDWQYRWWQHFGKHPNRELHIITIRNNGQLICIAPFYTGRSSLLGATLQKRLKLMGDGTSSNESFGFQDDYGRSDFLDIICDPDYEKQVAKTLYSMLTGPDYADHFDLLECVHINDRSFIKRELMPLFDEHNTEYSLEQTDICPSVEFADTFEEDYLYEVSSNTRRRLRQSLKAIGKEDGFVVEEVEEDELEKCFQMLKDIHQSRWNSIGYPGAFLDGRFAPFLLEYLKTAYKKGQLWFKVAKDKSGYCALRIALKFNGRYFDYMSGFEYEAPSAKYRPGIGLLTLAIKEGTEQGDKGIELLRGDERYKYDFTDIDYKNWKWSVPLRSNKNSFFKLKKSVTNFLASVYYHIDKERDLLKVQQKLHGTMQMFIKYPKVRIEMLKERFNES